MPIAIVPVKLKGRKKYSGEFKYTVIQKGAVPGYEEFPKHLLAETVEEAEAVFKGFSKTLNDLARSYASKSGLDRADLFGEGILGLARARRDFNPKRSSNFKTFAIYKIKDCLNAYVRSFSGPVAVPAYVRKVNRWINLLEETLRAAALCNSDIEAVLNGEKDALFPNDLHIFPDDLQEQYLRLERLISGEAKRLKMPRKALIKRARVIPRGDNSDVDSYSGNTEDQLDAKIVVEELKEHMTEIEISIANMIMEGRKYEEIAGVFGHKPPWVSQQLVKMRKRLKKRFKL